MRFFKSHPALAALIVLVSLGLFAPLAYAVVHRVWLTIDSDKSAPEIEDDMRQQLDNAGVNAEVHVDKSDDNNGEHKLEVSVTSDDPNAPEIGVRVDGRDEEGATRRAELRLEVKCDLSPKQHATLRATVSGSDFRKLIAERPDGVTDADIAAKIKVQFAAAGFRDVDVTIAGDSLTITIKAPPTR
jgi:hypothetical protein